MKKSIFGYLNGAIKVYKYLIEDQNPLHPGFEFDLEESRATWGSYNCSNNHDELIEKIFFLNSEDARASFVFSNPEAIKKILNYNNLESYYKGVFRELLNEDAFRTYTCASVVKVCEQILMFIRGNHLAHIDMLHDGIRYDYLSDTVEGRLQHYISDYRKIFNDSNNQESLINIIHHVLDYMPRYRENDWILGELLRILAEIFENIRLQMTEEYNERGKLNYLISMTFNTLEFVSNT